MKKIRNLIAWLILIAATTFTVIYREQIITYLLVEIIYADELTLKEKNKYYNDSDYLYLKNTNDFSPSNKEELLNIFYTIVNSGWEEFSFTCDIEYKNCVNDIQELLNNTYPLSYINNFIHPYNSFKSIEITTNNYGRVEVYIDKLYSEEEIKLIENELNKIYNQLTTNNMTDYDKIKTIHDYIVNNTKYLLETEKDEKGNSIYPLGTNKAYGPIINHVANCGGYTDLMTLFLYKMNIKNLKISNEEHIWNLIYIDNNWKHLDLTWDDPITDTGADILTHNFFLISSDELANKNVAEHNYDKKVFRETEKQLEN